MIEVEKREWFWIVKISSPQTLNALSSKIISDLDKVVRDVWDDDSVKVLLITGVGRSFSAGADVKELYNLQTQHQAYLYLRRGQEVFSKIENLKVPTISLIRGFALGGGLELALSTTFRIASENAKLGLPEIKLGIIPGYGGTQRLTKLVGMQKAREIIMTGDFVPAETALKIGLIDYIVKDEELENFGIKFAEKFKDKNPVALRYIKELTTPISEEGFKLEAEMCANLIVSETAKEKMKEFLEKKK